MRDVNKGRVIIASGAHGWTGLAGWRLGLKEGPVVSVRKTYVL